MSSCHFSFFVLCNVCVCKLTLITKVKLPCVLALYGYFGQPVLFPLFKRIFITFSNRAN